MRVRAIIFFVLLLPMAGVSFAGSFTKPGWYRLEVFPALEIVSGPFANEKACRARIPADEDHVRRCVRLRKAGDEVDRAIDIFGDIVKAEPRNTQAMNLRGMLFQRKGQMDAAIAEFTKAIEANPDDYWGFVFRGDAYKKMGKRELAIADYREALARNPGDAALVQALRDKIKTLGG